MFPAFIIHEKYLNEFSQKMVCRMHKLRKSGILPIKTVDYVVRKDRIWEI
jgi:hypothetical protein